MPTHTSCTIGFDHFMSHPPGSPDFLQENRNKLHSLPSPLQAMQYRSNGAGPQEQDSPSRTGLARRLGADLARTWRGLGEERSRIEPADRPSEVGRSEFADDASPPGHAPLRMILLPSGDRLLRMREAADHAHLLEGPIDALLLACGGRGEQANREQDQHRKSPQPVPGRGSAHRNAFVTRSPARRRIPAGTASPRAWAAGLHNNPETSPAVPAMKARASPRQRRKLGSRLHVRYGRSGKGSARSRFFTNQRTPRSHVSSVLPRMSTCLPRTNFPSLGP